MTVGELTERLSAFDPSQEVLIYNPFLSALGEFSLIEDVDEYDGNVYIEVVD